MVAWIRHKISHYFPSSAFKMLIYFHVFFALSQRDCHFYCYLLYKENVSV